MAWWQDAGKRIEKVGLGLKASRPLIYYWQPVKAKSWVIAAPGDTTTWVEASKKAGRLDGEQSEEPGFKVELIGTKTRALIGSYIGRGLS